MSFYENLDLESWKLESMWKDAEEWASDPWVTERFDQQYRLKRTVFKLF